MKAQSINQNNVILQSSKIKEQTLGKVGDIISGTVLGTTDNGLLIDINGQHIKTQVPQLHNIRPGSNVNFKIEEITNKKVVLKPLTDIEDTTNTNRTNNTNGVTVNTNATTFIGMYEKELSGDSNVDELKDKINNIINRLTEEDYSKLIERGINPEKIDIDSLATEINNVLNTNGIYSEEQITELASRFSNLSNNEELLKSIITKLKQANLPINAANISKIIKALNKANSIGSLTDISIVYILKNEIEPSIDNLYMAQHSVTPHQDRNNTLTKEQWNSLRGQVEQVIKRSSLEVNEANLNLSKWILDNNLPLTEDSITNIYNLKNGINQEYLLGSIVQSIQEGNKPEDAVVIKRPEPKQIEDVISSINNIKDNHIQSVVRDNKPINIHNLYIETKKENEDNISKEVTLTEDENIKYISAKRNLEEIRLRLTIEAGRRLVGKGIKIETENLEKIVDELRSLEDDYYKSLLSNAQVEVNDENIGTLRETDAKIRELSKMPDYTIGKVLHQKSMHTVNELHSEGHTLQRQLEKANISYDTLMTSPRKDLGDSIQKAFNNIDSLLLDIGLETSYANRRAVKILGYNGIEITSETLEQVKQLDSNVNHMLKNMHPLISAHLIKKGINPLDTDVQELNYIMDNLKKELGIDSDEKFSHFIWQMDKDKALTPEERKGLIGIYRLLNAVEKSDGRPIGVLYKQGREITLNNLLTALRISNSKGMDIQVDNKFGFLENIEYGVENITQQLELLQSNDTNNESKAQYVKNVIKQITENLSPSLLNELLKENIMDMSLEELNNIVQQNDNNNTNANREFITEQLAKLQQLNQITQEEMKIINDYRIPVNLNNLLSVQGILARDSKIFKDIQKLLEEDEQDNIEDFETAIIDKETLMDQYERLENKLEEAIDKLYLGTKVDSKQISDIQRIQDELRIIKNLGEQEYFNIPIIVEDDITQMQVRLIKSNSDIKQIHLRVSSDILGNVEASMSIQKNVINGVISTDIKKGMDALKRNQETLLNTIKGQGLEVDKIDICMRGKQPIYHITKQPITLNKYEHII